VSPGKEKVSRVRDLGDAKAWLAAE
jgi:hypothetical protein